MSFASISPSFALDNDLTLYVWGPSISGTATLNELTLPQSPVDVDFEDVIDDIKMGFMMHYEGMGEQWGGGFDFAYVDLGNTNDAGISADIKSTISEAFAIYRVNEVFDLLGGVRFTGMDMSVTGPGGIGDAEGDRSLTDFYVGGRVAVPFSDKWRGALRADVGTGDSDLVWNVTALLDWQVSKSVALRGGYRWIDYDIEKDGDVVDAGLDLSLDGAFLGIGFQW